MAGPVRIAILANGRQARAELTSVGGAFDTLGKKLRTGLAVAGIGSLTAGVVGLGKAAISTEAEFSTSMRMIQAQTKASADEVRRLNDLAIQLGQDTSFSANEAASAMVELSKAGLDAQQILGGGAAGALQLAAAGGTDLATAATIAANAMGAFRLEARDLDEISAALAGGANASTASVESLGQALSQVGPGARNAGANLNETIAALAAFDQAGVKGSDAGTSLKTMLQRLIPQTKKAAEAFDQLGLDFVKGNGEFESLASIAGQLQDKLGGLSDAARTVAINTIFGSDASRAATVLMQQGEEGLRKFIRATKDQNAAQKLAETRMSGTAGALERLSGSVETAQLRLGQELAPAVERGADLLAENMVPAMEAVISGAKDLGRAVSPAVQEIADALDGLLSTSDDLGNVWDDALVPAVEALADVLGTTVDLVDGLPGPLKEVGLQAGLAALVLPRFAGAVATSTKAVQDQITYLRVLKLEMSDTNSRGAALAGVMGRLGGAARTAAGIGGMVALTQGATESNEALSVLYATAGGAATGFSVGGPWGAAIGGAAGLIGSLAQATRDAEPSVRDYTAEWAELKTTLDEVTGATTEVTRAFVYDKLQRDGIIAQLQQYGITARTAVNAVLGQEGASRKVAFALQAEQAAVEELTAQIDLWQRQYDQFDYSTATAAEQARHEQLGQAINDLKAERQAHQDRIGVIKAGVGAVKEETAAMRERSKAATEWGDRLRGLPKDVRTDIKTNGIEGSLRDVARLAVAYELTPKQIETLMQVEGVSASKRAVERAIADMRTIAATQSPGVGAAATSGIIAGLNDLAITDAFVGHVKTAISAAKAAAKIKSPSQVTRDEIGRELARGVEVGLLGRKTKGKDAAKEYMQALLAGVTEGSQGVEAALDRVTRHIERQIKAKKPEKEAKREREALKALKAQYAQLRANGVAQDAINDKLEAEQRILEELTQQRTDYAQSVRDSFLAFGNITQLGQDENGATTLDGMLAELRDNVTKAKAYQNLLLTLSSRGINEVALRQLQEAGVEGGLAAAQALADGGQAAVDEVNVLMGELGAAGQGLGDHLADKFYTAGVRAQQGIVNGLLANQQALLDAAGTIADTLVKEVKKKLKIKSPSRVFREIGSHVVEGLGVGLDETYVSRQGHQLATSLVKGFGTPALDAYMSTSAATGAPAAIPVRLSAEEVDQLRRGKEIALDLAAYRDAGGRV